MAPTPHSTARGAFDTRATITPTVIPTTVELTRRPVADHERIWAKHQTISADEHVAAARAMRAERVGLLRPTPATEVEIRALGDYDAALRLTDGGVA